MVHEDARGVCTALTVGDGRFDDLFRRLYAPLLGLANRVLGDRLEAKDVLQEAFLHLAGSPVLAQADEQAAAWLRRVCLNLSFSRLRGQRRERVRLERTARLRAAAPPEDDPAGLAVRAEERERMRRALAALPERQRDCLLPRHSGYAYTEIAATLGVAVGSVGVLLARGEQALRRIFEEEAER